MQRTVAGLRHSLNSLLIQVSLLHHCPLPLPVTLVRTYPTLPVTFVLGHKRRLTNCDIEILAEHIGRRWRKLGKLIGLTPGQIENIMADYENQKDRIRAMLEKWQQVYGSKATLTYILPALRDLGLRAVAARLPPDGGNQSPFL